MFDKIAFKQSLSTQGTINKFHGRKARHWQKQDTNPQWYNHNYIITGTIPYDSCDKFDLI